MDDRKQLDAILAVGNTQARERASRFLRAVREAIGVDRRHRATSLVG
jgi:hypothetical protein